MRLVFKRFVKEHIQRMRHVRLEFCKRFGEKHDNLTIKLRRELMPNVLLADEL